jgi:hypothetical protein
MRYILFFFAVAGVIIACNDTTSDVQKQNEDIAQQRNREHADMVQHGQYLVTIGGCHDCHSPKIFNPQGFSFDSSRLLSGHPAGSPLPPFDPKATQPGNWMNFAPDLTAFVGPWGVTYSANLTPDSTTGLGGWTEETFIKALRTGKHMGIENGRPILPPMPWELFKLMPDEDLRAVFAYLKSLPPINNRIPDPVPPNEVARLNNR